MTAIDELRRLLDERGVEYDGHLVNHTTWVSGNAVWAAHEYDGKLDVWIAGGTINDLTPQQAIDATLGRGECHTVAMDCFGNPPFNQSGLNGNSTACGCSECGAPWSTMGIFRGNQLKHNFKACPICGRLVTS